MPMQNIEIFWVKLYKISLVFFFFFFFFFSLLKTLIVGKRKNHLAEAVLTSTRNLCFRPKIKNRYSPAYPSFFFYIEVGFKGYILHGHVFLMFHLIRIDIVWYSI